MPQPTPARRVAAVQRPDAARLCERIRGQPEIVTRDEHMARTARSNALEATSQADTTAVAEPLEPLTVAAAGKHRRVARRPLPLATIEG